MGSTPVSPTFLNFNLMRNLIILLPFLSFVICITFGRFLGSRGVSIITILSLAFSFFFSLFNLYYVINLSSINIVSYFPWIDNFILNLHWSFQFDSLASVMFVVVTFVSLLVHFYSVGYMYYDPHLIRFMSYLSLFTFFMLMLVTAGNLFQLFLGWEGVGLVSYLLINFWYTRLQANKSAIKAIIINKFGDFALVLAMLMLYDIFKSLDFSIIFANTWLVWSKFYFLGFSIDKLTIIGFLLLIGAVGKSAQLGLHTWLPDAMEGPTPVSALIHAATMVTAGVFLLVRCSPILEYSSILLLYIMLVGGLTAFFAGLIGLVQNDLKRVIAFSTCSQLGYMVFSCGMSNYSLAMFHLSNHAFFKALLFLCAGSVIHGLANEQDMRRMGNLIVGLPLTYVLIFIGSLALMGFPFLTGFYSKDVILETISTIFIFEGLFVYWLGLIAAFCTAFYSIRLLYLTFIKLPMMSQSDFTHSHESNIFITLPLILLGFSSIFIGYLTKDLFIGLGSSFWLNSIFVLQEHSRLVNSEFIPTNIKILPLIFTVISSVLSFFIYKYSNSLSYNFLNMFKLNLNVLSVYKFISHKWFFDQIYNAYIVKYFLNFGFFLGLKIIDQGLIQFFGARGLISFFDIVSNRTSYIQSGFIYHYTFLMFSGVFLLILLLLSF
jgi:proton-translocating NADH-quinone oxidoreductase chain L